MNEVSWRRSYSAYGYATGGACGIRLGFSGQLFDDRVQGYLLGNGYRLYSPIRMRFNSPDLLSPFEVGWINAYAYCEGDPVNHVDPSGRGLLKLLGIESRTNLTSGLRLAGFEPEKFKPFVKSHFSNQGAGPLELQVGELSVTVERWGGVYKVIPGRTRGYYESLSKFYVDALGRKTVDLSQLQQDLQGLYLEVNQLKESLAIRDMRSHEMERRAITAEAQLASIQANNPMVTIERQNGGSIQPFSIPLDVRDVREVSRRP